MKSKPLYLSLIIVASLLVWAAGSVDASVLVPQTALPGICVPQWAVPMPVFGPAGQNNANATKDV
jgi:spore coat protein A, manganese oxidase